MSRTKQYDHFIKFSDFYEYVQHWNDEQDIEYFMNELHQFGLLIYTEKSTKSGQGIDEFKNNRTLKDLNKQGKLDYLYVNRGNVASAYHAIEEECFPWKPREGENAVFEGCNYVTLDAFKYIPKSTSGKHLFERKIKIRQCKEECYLHYFNQRTITVRDAISILNGIDPRKQKIKSNQFFFKPCYQAISRAVKKIRPDLKWENGSKFGINSNLSSNQFFKWADEKYPEFNKFLPEDIPWVPKQGALNFQFAFGVELSQEEKLERSLATERSRVKVLEAKLEKARIIEEKHIKYRESQRIKAEKPRRKQT